MEPLAAGDPGQVGPYRLRARLGSGGMGQVYLGYSPGGRAVAVKVIHRELAKDPAFRTRFRREVAAARAVSGAYTAPVTAAGPDDDPPWLATAFVPGPSLAGAVALAGPLPELAVWRLAAGLVEALQAVHAAELVHRDLKPANVLLATDGPRLIDFGISQAIEGTRMTSTGLVVGTASFMSPEQANGADVGRPSDVFSLGSVIVFAALGTGPFGDGPLAATLYRVVNTDPTLDGMPAGLRDLVAACLAKAPASRPTLERLVGAITVGLGPDAAGGLTSFWPGVVTRMIDAYHDRLVTEIPGPPVVADTWAQPPGTENVPAAVSPAGAGPGSTAVSVPVPPAGPGSTSANPAPAFTPAAALGPAAPAYAPFAAPGPAAGPGPVAAYPAVVLPSPAYVPGSAALYGAAAGAGTPLQSPFPDHQGMPRPPVLGRPGGVTRRKLLAGLALIGAMGVADVVWELTHGSPSDHLASSKNHASVGQGARSKSKANAGATHPAGQQPAEPQSPAETASGHKVWALQTGQAVASTIAVANGVVYFGNNGFNVCAADISTGRQIWSVKTDDDVTAGLAVAGGAVYAGTYVGNLWALQASNGSKLWTYPADSLPGAQIAVADGKVYAGALSTVVLAVSASDGAKVWQYSQGGSAQTGLVVADHVVYAGSGVGNAVALRADTGDVIWNTSVGVTMTSGIAVADGVVFAAGTPPNISAISASSGDKLWSFTLSADIWSGIAAANGVVCVACMDGNIYGLSTSDGDLLWKFPAQGQMQSGIAMAGGRVYVGSGDNTVYALDAATGRQVWAFQTLGAIQSGITVADGVVYFGSFDGNLYAVRA